MPAAFHGRINDVLLTALVLAIADGVVDGAGAMRCWLMSRAMAGRRFSTMSICRARWAGSPACSRCASIPARLISTRHWLVVPALGRAVKIIKEQLRAIPDNGFGYGLLRYLNPQTALQLAGSCHTPAWLQLSRPLCGFRVGRLGRHCAGRDAWRW